MIAKRHHHQSHHIHIYIHIIEKVEMLLRLLNYLLWMCVVNAYVNQKLMHTKSNIYNSVFKLNEVTSAPYDDIIPYLSEHIQLSDQLLVVGATTDLALKLNKDGFGAKKTGFMLVIDDNIDNINEIKELAMKDDDLKQNIEKGILKFQHVDYTNMPQVCTQSFVDAIVDYGGLDSILKGKQGKQGMIKCIDHLQDAVRLGNILVCLSTLEKDEFCESFNERFGWVQELDGDPGEISAWYRGKSNIQKSESNFKKHNLKMFVYTNTDNC